MWTFQVPEDGTFTLEVTASLNSGANDESFGINDVRLHHVNPAYVSGDFTDNSWTVSTWNLGKNAHNDNMEDVFGIPNMAVSGPPAVGFGARTTTNSQIPTGHDLNVHAGQNDDFALLGSLNYVAPKT